MEAAISPYLISASQPPNPLINRDIKIVHYVRLGWLDAYSGWVRGWVEYGTKAPKFHLKIFAIQPRTVESRCPLMK